MNYKTEQTTTTFLGNFYGCQLKNYKKKENRSYNQKKYLEGKKYKTEAVFGQKFKGKCIYVPVIYKDVISRRCALHSKQKTQETNLVYQNKPSNNLTNTLTHPPSTRDKEKKVLQQNDTFKCNQKKKTKINGKPRKRIQHFVVKF